MPLPAGTRLGPYEVVAPLGAGGMGEVYRARDTRLGRDVAIKVLPQGFEADPDRIVRFEREAKLLASLNHPNVAVLYGVEHLDGMLCLVLELIEGESLAQRLQRGPLPMDEAFDVAAQVAAALEAAHEAGVVHRDLKPGNVMLRPDGVAKVLDFGLARGPLGATTPGVPPSLSQSPTMTSPATMPGMILGTAAYMSPEQAKGRVADRRADLWAWGCLLYELLTGRRAFPGEDVSETLASILKSEPDWAALPRDTPLRVRELLARCLRKDVRERLRDAGDARVLLTEARTHVEAPATSTPARAGVPWLVALGLLGLGIAATLGILQLWGPHDGSARAGILRLPFLPPDSVSVDDRASNFAVISPDGRNLLFAGRTPHGVRQLWLRPLDSMVAQPLAGTDGANEPFWSPDGRSIAFAADGKLKRLDLSGGQPKVLADAARMCGGTWSRSGVIVFSPDFSSVLDRVSADGGPTTLVARPDSTRGETGYRSPSFLPDGRHLLYRVDNTGGYPNYDWFVRRLDGNDTKRLIQGSPAALYAPPGWLLFARGGSMFAQRFDAAALRLSGEPLPIQIGAPIDQNFTNARFSTSQNGVLVAQIEPAYSFQLTWYDRAGKRLGLLGPEMQVHLAQSPSLSADRSHVVFQRQDPQTGIGDIWTIDVARGTLNRLTSDPTLDQLPLWAVDGRSVFENTRRNGVAGIYRISANGGDERFMAKGGWPTATTPDGRFLIFMKRGEKTRQDIWLLPLTGGGPARVVLATEFNDSQPQISPDGHWLAYASDETGSYEVYARPFSPETGVGDPVRISTGGGFAPRWRGDGRELFYVSAPISAADGRLMATSIKVDGARLEPGTPIPLFATHMMPDGFTPEFDVSADGQRFLVGTATRDPHATGVNLLLNWTELLR